MLRILMTVLMLCLAPMMVQAQEVLAPNPDIEATITGQFDAFRAGDVPEAWDYASPNIQRLFQSPKPVIAGSTLFASILANVVSVGGFGVCACCRSSGGVVGTVPGAACGEECASFYVLNLPFDHSFHPIQTCVAPWEAATHRLCSSRFGVLDFGR